MTSAVEHREVVVVGSGQAGLAIGYFLAQQGRRFVILEAADEPGAAWRSRWDSMRLFTPVRYDGLPGLAFPGEADSYPGRDDVIAYLTEYARHFELPVELNRRVQSVRARDGRGFLVGLAGGTYEADQVVVESRPAISTISGGCSTPWGRRRLPAMWAPSNGTSIRSAVGSSSSCAAASAAIACSVAARLRSASSTQTNFAKW